MAGASPELLAELIRRYHSTINARGLWWRDEITEVLGALLQHLPNESGIRTYNALTFALASFIDDIGLDSDAMNLLRALTAYFQPRPFDFSIAVAGEAGYSIPVLKVGGRYELRLLTQAIAGRSAALLLQGKVRAGHWFTAMELAETLAEEVSGLLAASAVLSYDAVPFGLTRFPGELKPVLISGSDAHGERVTQTHAMNWNHVRSVLSAAVAFPRDVTEMEGQRAIKKEGEGEEDVMGQLIRDRMQAALRAFSIGGPDSKRVRQAAQFLHRAEITESPADSYLAMATALEGLLVQGDVEQLSARLADAVAFNIATSHSDRAKLRALAKKLYDVRSKYIHQGNYTGTEGHRHECLRMVERVVWHESRLLRAVDRRDTDAGSE